MARIAIKSPVKEPTNVFAYAVGGSQTYKL